MQHIAAAAIRNRRRLFLRYGRRDVGRRVEPHVLFVSQDGHLSLLAYQVDGYRSSSRRGSGPYWRPFQLRKIDHLTVLGELFDPRFDAGYMKVLAVVGGEVLLRVREAGEYSHFDGQMHGPPSPNRDNWAWRKAAGTAPRVGTDGKRRQGGAAAGSPGGAGAKRSFGS